jgi:hypothetical protein
MKLSHSVAQGTSILVFFTLFFWQMPTDMHNFAVPSLPGSVNRSSWTSWPLETTRHQLSKGALLHNIPEDFDIGLLLDT